MYSLDHTLILTNWHIVPIRSLIAHNEPHIGTEVIWNVHRRLSSVGVSLGLDIVTLYFW